MSIIIFEKPINFDYFKALNSQNIYIASIYRKNNALLNGRRISFLECLKDFFFFFTFYALFDLILTYFYLYSIFK